MDNVISWGGGEFLGHKAKQMGKVVPGEACCSEAGGILGLQVEDRNFLAPIFGNRKLVSFSIYIAMRLEFFFLLSALHLA